MKRKRVVGAVTALAVFTTVLYALFSQASNQNGVYFNVKASAEVNNYYWSNELFYGCDDAAADIKVSSSDSLIYCTKKVKLKANWNDKMCEQSKSNNILAAFNNCDSSHTHTGDDSNSAHCETGHAVVFDAVGCGSGPGPGTDVSNCAKLEMRDTCEMCSYTGGPCE